MQTTGLETPSRPPTPARCNEQLGAAGLQIDDKVLPANHPARDEIIDWELMGPKIQAVRDNVSDDFVIVYRTCADLYNYGIDESIRRINLAIL